jgi:hypothetical protein
MPLFAAIFPPPYFHRALTIKNGFRCSGAFSRMRKGSIKVDGIFA